jgi:hypothetical protein
MQHQERDFDSLDQEEGQGGGPYATDDIEAALASAEALLFGGGGGGAGGASPAFQSYPPLPHVDQQYHHQEHQHVQQQQQQRQQHGGEQVSPASGFNGGSGGGGGEAAQRPRPLSAFSLGEQAMTLRLTVHEKEMELLQLRAQHLHLAVRGCHACWRCLRL